MRDFTYVKNFDYLGFGMFVHFGLYSVLAQASGEIEDKRITQT